MNYNPITLVIDEKGGANGEPVLAYNDGLYNWFRAILLGKELIPFISASNTEDRKFLEGQKRSLQRFGQQLVGRWYPTERSIYGAIEKNLSFGAEPVYETAIKFSPPIAIQTLTKMLERFQNEMGIENVIRYIDKPMRSMGYQPGGAITGASMEIAKIYCLAEKFGQIRPHITLPDKVTER